MTPKEFYEQQRQLGFTDNITSNPNPNYSEPFYCNIFTLMAAYATEEMKKEHDRGIEDGKTIQAHGSVHCIE